MIRGTTPKHTFTLPFETQNIAKVRVIYAQRDKVLFKKDDVTMEGDTVSVHLTQEDTFTFTADVVVTIQIRVLMQDGQAYASQFMKATVCDCLDDEVLT